MKVEIWADVLCPWCFIVERRIMKAVASLDDPSRVDVIWRSYELAPELSRTPTSSAAEQMRAPDWWGEEADHRIDQIRRLGHAEGIDMNLELARPVNTFDAHRLVHLGAAHGVADAVMASLMRAYHTDGRNIADPAVLHEVGLTASLPGPEVTAMIESDAYTDAVWADEGLAEDLGVRGVPSIRFDRRPPVPGVLSVDDLRDLLGGG